jgi:hypothetical protein
MGFPGYNAHPPASAKGFGDIGVGCKNRDYINLNVHEFHDFQEN